MPRSVRQNYRTPYTLWEYLKIVPYSLARFPRFQKNIYKSIKLNAKVRSHTKITIGDFFDEAVKKNPNGIVLYFEDKKWTYTEFDQWVNRLANYLLSLGLKKGDKCVLLLDNRPEVISISMALAKIGCVASLINYSQRSAALVHSIKLSKASKILVGKELIDNFNEVEEKLDPADGELMVIPPTSEETVETKGDRAVFNVLAKDQADTPPQLDYDVVAGDPIMYVFTSGTTGMPKAAVVTHARWIKGYAAFGCTLSQLKKSDIMYVPLPFYHSTAMIVCWTSVIAGASGMVMKRKFSVKDFWPDVHHYKATVFGYVGELCKYLINAPEHQMEKNNTLTKMVGNGLRSSLWSQFKQRFEIDHVGEFYASSEGNLAFFNMFNMDYTMGLSINPYKIVKYDKEKDEIVRDAKGRCIKVKKGETGLLLSEINEKFPFDGYTEKDKSEKTILRNCFVDGDQYFNTNDLVFDMGFMHTQFVDRLGDTFRWKSENVSTTEVEGITHQMFGVQEGIVYGVEIPNRPGRAGMATIILKPGCDKLDLKVALAHYEKELPPYAIPLFLRFTDEKNIQKTETMKHQKSGLKEQGYDCNVITDEMYFLAPGEGYIPLTPEVKAKIDKGEYRI